MSEETTTVTEEPITSGSTEETPTEEPVSQVEASLPEAKAADPTDKSNEDTSEVETASPEAVVADSEVDGEQETATETPAVEPSTQAEATAAEEKPAESKTKPRRRVKARPKVTISLRRGQEIQGVVKTITDFGAFVDINLPQDGLVHISELARHRVENVKDVVSVGDEVTVWVKSLDKERNRISLTMRKPVELRYSDIDLDEVYEGEVTRIENYGVFVNIGLEREGLVHVSELAHEYVKTPSEVVSVGDTVKVKIVKINKRKKQVNLSMKALMEPPEGEAEAAPEAVEEEIDFEEDSEPMATSMAAAFDRFNTASRKRSKKKSGKPHRRKRSNLEDVISRTLKTQKES